MLTAPAGSTLNQAEQLRLLALSREVFSFCSESSLPHTHTQQLGGSS